MNIESVLVSFKVNENEKTNETSGILFHENTVLIPGTSLIPLVHKEKWISSFVKSSSPELRANEHIQRVFFRVFVELKRNSENDVSKEFYALEAKAVGVWKCPLVAESLKKLFYDWTLKHGNFEHESEVLSSDNIDLSKELMSIFILLKCKGRGELKQTKERNKSDDNIRVLFNLMSKLQKPNRGQEVEVISTPFGNEHFMNSLSRGLISNVVGLDNCIILFDARTVSGCEGGPIFVAQSSRKEKQKQILLGIVACPLTWWRGEWVGFTIGISLMPVLKTLLRLEDDSISIETKSFSSDLSTLNLIDETMVLVRSKTSWGSGVVLNSASGIIITCSHVIKDDNKVTVFQKGNQYPADVVFKSQDNIAYDLAVIKTGSDVFKNEVKFSKNPAKLGEEVIAAGFPFFSERDVLNILPSIATGCVSRVNPYMIQTTCCIQSGFSGGGLFRDGELLGIIVSNVRDSTAGALFPHINFIAPSSAFKEHILKYIRTNDKSSLRDLECSNIKVMEASLKLQLDVRNNAQDLQNYLLDLNNWEEEMKRKELSLNNETHLENDIPPPRNKIKRSKPENEKNSNKPKKISAYDYSAWDKFDVEKACAEIDKYDGNDDNEQINKDVNKKDITVNEEKDNKNLSLIDEAFYEKEMGNNFVKKEQWADAIKCYTNAINLESNNAIYYANRSLCFLKLQNFKAAETDATTAIQLDNNYVKAYQRRAFARQALGQLQEAKSDYEEILKLEPKNALSRSEINKIDERLKKGLTANKPLVKKTFDPKNMFKSEDSKAHVKQSLNSSEGNQKAGEITKNEVFAPKASTTGGDSNCKRENTSGVNCKKYVTANNKTSEFEKGGDGDKIVPSQTSKPRHEIFKPLPECCKVIHPVNIPPHKRSKKPLRKINITVIDHDDNFNFEEELKSENSNMHVKAEEKVIVNKPIKEERVQNERVSFDVPKTAIQFQKNWKILKNNPEEAYNYLKKISVNELPQIFENSLESDFFSELVNFLASDNIEKEPTFVYDFLLGLSSVKRFSSLTLFMSEADKNLLKKCLTELEKVKSKEEIFELQRLYELRI